MRRTIKRGSRRAPAWTQCLRFLKPSPGSRAADSAVAATPQALDSRADAVDRVLHANATFVE
jgi:hypothetical protein